MKKLLILLTIPLFLFLNTNFTSASTNSLDIIDNYSPDNTVLQNEDYQNGYRQGYEDGFSHKNRIKIELWKYDNFYVTELETVYRFNFQNFVSRYSIISPDGLTYNEVRNKVFIPTFNGYVSNFAASIRQWWLSTSTLYLYVEKPLINTIMMRDNVDVVTAFKTYLEENNIYGYFERANGLTDYEIGYNTGYEQGFNTAMKDTTTNLISSILLLFSPILLLSIILQIFNKFKEKN